MLDRVATRAGEPAGSAIAQTVELARHVEQLGYKRFWVAEHHHSGTGLLSHAGADRTYRRAEGSWWQRLGAYNVTYVRSLGGADRGN